MGRDVTHTTRSASRHVCLWTLVRLARIRAKSSLPWNWVGAPDSPSILGSDQIGIAFSDKCPQYIINDHGVEKTMDCGNTWFLTGGGSGGLHALQIYDVTWDIFTLTIWICISELKTTEVGLLVITA